MGFELNLKIGKKGEINMLFTTALLIGDSERPGEIRIIQGTIVLIAIPNILFEHREIRLSGKQVIYVKPKCEPLSL
jgi:hypothetical protein